MILRTLQFFYNLAAAGKNKLYDLKKLKNRDVGVPVVSIGNISMGGTGKTPFVIFLATELSRLPNYRNITVINRSYKGQLRRPQKVDISYPEAARVFGDEACLLQTKLPQCNVWSGPVKFDTAVAAVSENKPNIILVDDGFSHRQLKRDCDIVLIDATASLDKLQTLPYGHLREPLSELKRASAIVITKVNLAGPVNTSNLVNMLLAGRSYLRPRLYFCDVKLNSGELSPNDNLFIFCGVGNPQSLKTSLVELGYKISLLKAYPDHYYFQSKDLNAIWEEFNQLKRTLPDLKLVATSKDLIKIKDHPLLAEVHQIDYTIEMDPLKKEELIEKVISCFSTHVTLSAGSHVSP